MQNQNFSLGNQRSHKNGSFKNSLGFVLARVGSAVGIGNIWLFPYRLGEYGGYELRYVRMGMP